MEPLENWIPKSTEVTVSEEQLQCIQHTCNLQIREQVKWTMEKVNCVVLWPNDAASTVKLEQIRRGSESEDREWSELCTGTVSRLLCDIITRKLITTPTVFGLLKVVVERETLEVDVKFDVGSSEIHFMGFTDSVAAFETKLMALKNTFVRQLEEEEERKKSIRKVETLEWFEPTQIRIFQQCGVADEVMKYFKTLDLRVDGQKVQLAGSDDILHDATRFIFKRMTQIKQEFLDLSQDLIKLITTEPAKTYVSEYLKQNKIKATIGEPQPGRKGVMIYANSQDDFRMASAFLEAYFVTVNLELDDAARHAMRSPDWQELVESLTTDYSSVRLDSTNDVLVVVCLQEFEGRTLRKIREVFEKSVHQVN